MKYIILTLLFIGTSSNLIYSKDFKYYTKDFYDLGLDKSVGNYNPKEVQAFLRDILNSKHLKTRSYDKLVTSCSGEKKNLCYSHIQLDYSSEVRPLVMAVLTNQNEDFNGEMETPYCKKRYTVKRVSGNFIFPDHTIFNVEHTVPQFHFNKNISKKLQKSDLQNLWPVFSKMNSDRGHLDFIEFKGHNHAVSFCKESELSTVQGVRFFEPPHAHKGNVARAYFYFALKYKIKLPEFSIKLFKKWNKFDPVDAEEKQRASLIFKFQKNRNPFVDYPHLADLF